MDKLVGAREAAPDTGFMARMRGLCSLHHHLEFRVLAEAAHADIADVVTGPPVLSGKLYDPGRDMSINPNENSILTP